MRAEDCDSGMEWLFFCWGLFSTDGVSGILTVHVNFLKGIRQGNIFKMTNH